MDKLKMHSPDLSQDNIAKIRALFPGCVTEAKDEATGAVRLAVDFDQLRQELSDHIVDGPQERYRLDWPGKREALITANAPIAKSLRPKLDESVEFESTENLFIEGDNLEILKLLKETYLGKIKMIYIDPPYNTGSDLLYMDDFSESTQEYFQKTLQETPAGERMVANTEANGRFHSDWMSRIYSRLRVARLLLDDNGLLFVSIDDELANLKKIADEVFGEKNFIDIFSWQKTTTPPNLSKKTKKSVEYILAYQKKESGPLVGLSKTSKSSNGLMNQTNPIGQLTFPAKTTTTGLPDGRYSAGQYGTKSYIIELLEDTEVKDGRFTLPVKLRGKFKWSQPYLDSSIAAGTSVMIQTKAFSPSYEKSEYDPEKPWNIINKNFGVGTNENASDEVDALFVPNFSDKLYPKPVSLLKYLIASNTGEGDIIMDFYAGSGTTGHAVMELSSQDGKNRRFILAQWPEEVDPASEAARNGFLNIAEIAKERIRRAGKKILKGECHPDWNRDVGFRVLKVDTSNMKDVYYRPDELKQSNLLDMVDNVKEGRTAEDLLFQVLVDWGVDLTLPIRRETVQGKTVFFVDDNALVACFDRGITEDLVKELAGHEPLRVVFRDNGFVSDAVKINVEQIFRQLSPTTDVKSI